MNYEYVFVYKFDLVGVIVIEIWVIGIMSVVVIDEGKKSEYGNIVGLGILV